VNKHPLLTSFFRDNDGPLPETHPDINLMLADPAANPLPEWHPVLSKFQQRDAEPTLQRNVSFYHPSIAKAYADGVGIDVETHPDLQAFFEEVQPPSHPAVMRLLADPVNNPIPDWHPALDTFQRRGPEPKVARNVTFYHPNIDAAFRDGIGIDIKTHPNITADFAEVLPESHPPLMGLLADPANNPLPTDFDHPVISRFQHRSAEPVIQREVYGVLVFRLSWCCSRSGLEIRMPVVGLDSACMRPKITFISGFRSCSCLWSL
jgi:hypothetical protein